MFKNRGLFNYIKWVIVGLFIVLVAVQSGKNFVLDETDFPTVSNTTSQSGVPIYYHDELTQTSPGTYHPTLYINSLALFIRAFGFNETTVRVFGAICVLASAYLLVLIYRQLSPKGDRRLETLFLGLYLLNPYTIANATLPDIDPTVLPVLLLSFIYLAIRFLLQRKRMDNRVVAILGAFFALVLWSKLTTPLIIPPLLACLAYITSKDLRKSLVFTAKVTAVGALLFVVSYFIYCVALGLSTTYTYTFLLASFTKGTSTDGPLVGVINNLGNLRYFVYWLTIPIVGLIGVSTLSVLLDKVKDKETMIKKLLITTALLITIFYIALISPFGGFFKYPFPVFGILILSIIFFLEKIVSSVKINYVYGLISLFAGYMVEKLVWEDSMFLHPTPLHYFFLLALALVVVACYLVLSKAKKYKSVVASAFMIIVLFSLGFQLSISRIQAVAPYPTKYLYGQLGMKDAIGYLKANTASDEVIWSMKDVGFYVHNRFYESYAAYFDKSSQTDFVNLIKSGKVRYYVATTGIGQDNLDYYTDVRNILDTYGVKEKQFGNFVIYKSKIGVSNENQ